MTNSPAIALGLTADSIHVIVPPGELNQHMRVLTGRWTVDFLAELNIAVAFISAAGITLEHGLTTSRSGARGHAERGRGGGGEDRRAVRLLEVQALVAADRPQPPQSLDLVITDDGLDAVTIAEFRAAGVNLVVAAQRRSLVEADSLPRTAGS